MEPNFEEAIGIGIDNHLSLERLMKIDEFDKEAALRTLFNESPNATWSQILSGYPVNKTVLTVTWAELEFYYVLINDNRLKVRCKGHTDDLHIIDMYEFDSYVKRRKLSAAIDAVNNNLLSLGKAYEELHAICMQEIQPLIDAHKYDQAMATLMNLRVSKSKVGQDIYKRIVDEAHRNNKLDQLVDASAEQCINE